MRGCRVLSAALAFAFCLASESAFSVNDDLFAFPQYEIQLLDSYVLDSEPLATLHSNQYTPEKSKAAKSHFHDVSSYRPHGSPDGPTLDADEISTGTYERILLHGYPHICHIPEPRVSAGNDTTPEHSAVDREKELDRAVSRASQLLQEMASNQCLYYSTGWWTYSFCYNGQVTQFHALPPGTNGRLWPPQEDPTTPSYVLGKFNSDGSEGSPSEGHADRSPSTEVRSKAETNYLVQRLDGGTKCDLTGNDRKVEVQFHCNPQVTDRIAWIKETATCSYLMIIYTPRLCNDVTFQPPKETRVHPITCREIISEDDISSWETRRLNMKYRQAFGEDQNLHEHVMLGNVELGARKYMGNDGKRLERGRIVLTQDERAETVIMQKNGQISSLSKAELKKLDLSPEDVDTFRKELQKLAGTKDWKIERLDDVDGHVQLRGVVSADDDEEKAKKDSSEKKPEEKEPIETEPVQNQPDEQELVEKEPPEFGSEEEYIDEI
ncbi:Protein OS-9-like protein [Exophiala dermatitidis]